MEGDAELVHNVGSTSDLSGVHTLDGSQKAPPNRRFELSHKQKPANRVFVLEGEQAAPTASGDGATPQAPPFSSLNRICEHPTRPRLFVISSGACLAFAKVPLGLNFEEASKHELLRSEPLRVSTLELPHEETGGENITTFAFSPDGKHLLAGTHKGDLWCWQTAEGDDDDDVLVVGAPVRLFPESPQRQSQAIQDILVEDSDANDAVNTTDDAGTDTASTAVLTTQDSGDTSEDNTSKSEAEQRQTNAAATKANTDEAPNLPFAAPKVRLAPTTESRIKTRVSTPTMPSPKPTIQSKTIPATVRLRAQSSQPQMPTRPGAPLGIGALMDMTKNSTEYAKMHDHSDDDLEEEKSRTSSKHRHHKQARPRRRSTLTPHKKRDRAEFFQSISFVCVSNQNSGDQAISWLCLVCARSVVRVYRYSSARPAAEILLFVDEIPSQASIRSVDVIGCSSEALSAAPTEFATPSQEGSFCALGKSDGSLSIFSFDEDGNYPSQVAVVQAAHTAPISCVCFCPIVQQRYVDNAPQSGSEHALLLTAAEDRTVKVWWLSVGTGQVECASHVKGQYTGDIQTIVFHPTKPIFASVSGDYSIRIWSATTFQVLSCIENSHSSHIWHLLFHHDTDHLLSVASDGLLRVWSTIPYFSVQHCLAETDKFITRIHAVDVTSNAGGPQTKDVLVGTLEGTVSLCKFSESKTVNYIDQQPQKIECVWDMATFRDKHERTHIITTSAHTSSLRIWTLNALGTGDGVNLSTARSVLCVTGLPQDTISQALEQQAIRSRAQSQLDPAISLSSETSSPSPSGRSRVAPTLHTPPHHRATASASMVSPRELRNVRNNVPVAVVGGAHGLIGVIATDQDCQNFDLVRVHCTPLLHGGFDVQCIHFLNGVLALGCSNGSVFVWTNFEPQAMLNTQAPSLPQPKHTIRAHSSTVRDIVIMPNDGPDSFPVRVATVSNDQSLALHTLSANGDVDTRTDSHKGAVRGVCTYKQFIITASDCDGIKLWRTAPTTVATKSGTLNSTYFSMILELEGPCSTISLVGDTLFAAHGHNVTKWNLQEMLEGIYALQPVTGIADAVAVTVLRVPYESNPVIHAGETAPIDDGSRGLAARFSSSFFFDRSGSINGEEHLGGRLVTHMLVSQFKDDETHSASEWEQALLTFPWLVGVCLSAIAVSSNPQHFSLSYEQQQILRFVCQACNEHKQLFLEIDPFFEFELDITRWSKQRKVFRQTHKPTAPAFQRLRCRTTETNPSSHVGVVTLARQRISDIDSLVESLVTGNLTLVDLILFELLGKLWMERSMSIVFTADHFLQLIKHYPVGLIKFLKRHEGVMELTMEPNPPNVANDCERIFLTKQTVRGSFGLEPQNFWKSKIGDANFRLPVLDYAPPFPIVMQTAKRIFKLLGNQKRSTEQVASFRVGINHIIENRKKILQAAGNVAPKEVKHEIFALQTINCLIRYDVHENRAAFDFVLKGGLYLALTLLVSAFSLLATIQHHHMSTGERIGAGLLAGAIFAFNSVSAVEEFQQIRQHRFAYIQSWNLVDLARIFSTYGFILTYTIDSQRRFGFAAFTVLATWFKLPYYLRAFETFAFMVKALFQILLDLRSFVVILAIVMLGFANGFYILFRKNVHLDWNEFDGPNFDSARTSVMSTFAMLLGEFDTKVFLFGDESISWLASMMLVTFLLFGSVILLNVTIAIISNTFDELKRKKTIIFRVERSDMLVERQIGREVMLHPKHFWIQILVSDQEFRDKRSTPVTTSSVKLALEEEEASQEQILTSIQRQLRAMQQDLIALKQAIPNPRTARVPIRPAPSRGLSLGSRSAPMQVVNSKHPFLTGPATQFGLIPTPLRMNVSVADGSHTYEVDKTSATALLSLLDAAGVLSMGQFSQPSHLNSDIVARRALNIPEDAVAFAIAFPLVGAGHLKTAHKQVLSSVDCSFMFLLFGGIVYFNEEHQITAAHAFHLGGQDITFNPLMTWDQKLTRKLQMQRRFQPITIQELKNLGACYYTWVCPNEPLSDAGGSANWQFGAFAYLFHKDVLEKSQTQNDCFIGVSSECAFAKVVGREDAQPVEPHN